MKTSAFISILMTHTRWLGEKDVAIAFVDGSNEVLYQLSATFLLQSWESVTYWTDSREMQPQGFSLMLTALYLMYHVWIRHTFQDFSVIEKTVKNALISFDGLYLLLKSLFIRHYGFYFLNILSSITDRSLVINGFI